jgi:apolipoprotein N-acyltransferase
MNLAPRARFAWVVGAWGMLWLASPGVLFDDGSALLALVALVLWGLGASRPGKKAFLVEWLAAAIGISAICWWSTLVVWITLLGVAIVPAFYMACAGALLRRLVQRVPLALAVPLAWVALETLRSWVEPPLGFGWLRLGHYLSAVPWIAGSARVWGVLGLSFALAGAAGALADWIAARFRMTRGATPPNGGGQAARAWIARALATGPLALAPVLSLATSPPPMETGPRLLLVQPAFEQHRKMNPPSPEDLWVEMIGLTRKGLAGAGRVDLVCWGETLFPWYLEGGTPWGLARPPPWVGPISQADLQRTETEAIQRGLFERGVLPKGCSFLSGAELYHVHGGEVRRVNAAVLWGPDGKRIGWGSKLHLVPGGETMAGLERWAWVRSAAHELAGYVPDLVAAEETRVLELPVQGSRPVRLGLSICFDNTFDDPYTEPLRRGPLDAHIVLSNEAWYEKTCEYDHMLAFSRLAAIESGRAMARVTNSGISALFGPDGTELARLRVGGRDRMVGGALLVDLPVPTPGHAGDRTPYVRLEPYLRWLAVLFPLLLLGVWRPRAVTPSG